MGTRKTHKRTLLATLSLAMVLAACDMQEGSGEFHFVADQTKHGFVTTRPDPLAGVPLAQARRIEDGLLYGGYGGRQLQKATGGGLAFWLYRDGHYTVSGRGWATGGDWSVDREGRVVLPRVSLHGNDGMRGVVTVGDSVHLTIYGGDSVVSQSDLTLVKEEANDWVRHESHFIAAGVAQARRALDSQDQAGLAAAITTFELVWDQKRIRDPFQGYLAYNIANARMLQGKPTLGYAAISWAMANVNSQILDTRRQLQKFKTQPEVASRTLMGRTVEEHIEVLEEIIANEQQYFRDCMDLRKRMETAMGF